MPGSLLRFVGVAAMLLAMPVAGNARGLTSRPQSISRLMDSGLSAGAGAGTACAPEKMSVVDAGKDLSAGDQKDYYVPKRVPVPRIFLGSPANPKRFFQIPKRWARLSLYLGDSILQGLALSASPLC